MRRKRKREQRMPARMRAVILFVMIVIIGVSVGALFTPVFHITEVFCVGNERISQEEIIAAAEVPLGKNILLQRLSGIRERVAEIPMVEEVKARRIFPNRIKIWIRERVPAGYLYDGEGTCVVVDVAGKILDIIDDERVAQMKEFYTPVKIEPEKSKKPETDKEAAEEETQKEELAEEQTPEKTPESSEKPESPELQEPERPYTIPFVVGLKPHKPEIGKELASKERDKLSRVMEAFEALENAGLLVRATYLDVTDLTDVTLVIENRLEIQLGELSNMEYRSRFLATVIAEKISPTEHVIMDYRTNDIYVRPPEDGKERMISKPSEEPEETEESEEEE